MIEKISIKIASIPQITGTLSSDDIELYAYGFFILISKMVFGILTVLFGIIFGIVIECIIFYIAFMLLRGYAGGMHAGTEKLCTVLTTIAMFSSACLIRLADEFIDPVLAIIAGICCAIIIAALSPVESSAKPLSPTEYKRYRYISEFIVLGIIVVSITAYILNAYFIIYPITVCMLLETVLITLAVARES